MGKVIPAINASYLFFVAFKIRMDTQLLEEENKTFTWYLKNVANQQQTQLRVTGGPAALDGSSPSSSQVVFPYYFTLLSLLKCLLLRKFFYLFTKNSICHICPLARIAISADISIFARHVLKA